MRVHPLPSTNQHNSAFARICLLIMLLCCFASSQAQSDKQEKRGFTPGGSYAIGDIETISTTSGNLMFNIPLASLPPGRGGSPGASLKLIYNSKIWDPYPVFEPSGSSTVLRTYLNASQDGNWDYGFKYELQVIDKRYEYSYPYGGGPDCTTGDISATKVIKVRMRFPDGGAREFRPLGEASGEYNGYYDSDPEGREYYCHSVCGPSGCDRFIDATAPTYATRTYYSVDGTYLRLDIEYAAPDANGFRKQYWTLYFPDGGRVTTDPSQIGSGVQRIYDRNNNYTEIQNITYNTHPATKIVDSVGRNIIIENDSSTGQDYVYARGVGNVLLKTTIKWKNIRVYKTIATGDYNSTYPLFNYSEGYGFPVVDQIILPQQSGTLSYTFDYNASTTSPSNGWGEVSSVLLPTGARVYYTYRMDGLDNLSSLSVLKDHVVTKDLVYDSEYDGVSTQKIDSWQYQFGGGAIYDYQYQRSSQVTAPDGGVTRQNFYNGDYNSDEKPLSGMVYYTENPDSSVVERLWNTNGVYEAGSQTAVAPNPYIKTEFTSIRDAAGNLSKTAIKDYNYDKNGNVTQVKEYDWVAYSSVPRDANSRPTGIPAGAVLKQKTVNNYYNDTPDASDTTTDDPDSYHKSTSPRLRNAVEFSEVGNGSQTLTRTEFFYDNATMTGNLTQQKRWDSAKGAYSNLLSAANSVSISTQYDSYGNIILSTDANGIQSQYVYGAVGSYTDLYPTQVNAASGTALKRTTNLAYDFWTGLTTLSTDADNNVATATSYDVFGRPTLVQAADGKPEETQTSMTYSDVGRYVITRSDKDALGDRKLVSVQHYDQMGRIRLTRQLEDKDTQSETNEADGIKVQTRYFISGSNNYQLTSNPYRAATSGAASTEATMGWTRSKSDDKGRVVEVRSYSGSGLPAPWGTNANTTGAVTTAYDANYTTVTDQAGKLRRSMVDGLGRLVRVDEPNASNSLGTVTAPVQPTNYTYDALSNLTQVSQGTQTRTFAYSSLSRLTSAVNPESGTTNYIYDANGNLTQKTDARSATTTYVYDALNRITSRTYSDTTPGVSYTYDAVGVAYARGRLKSVSSSVSTTNYTAFDPFGRIKASSQVTDGQIYQMSYAYDRAGNLTSQTYPSGRVVTNSFDKAGRLSQVSGQKAGEANKTYVSQISYGSHGAVTEMKMGNNLWEHTIFNNRLQPVLIGLGTSQTIPTAQDFNRFRMDYSYGTTDNNGNVRQQTISVPDSAGNYVAQVAQYYDYDELNRLKSATELNGATQSWKQTYLYDRFGNRRFDQMQTTLPVINQGNQYATNPAISGTNNRIVEDQNGDAVKDYQYDAAGNLKCDLNHPCPTTTQPYYEYDAENRLVKNGGGANINSGTAASYFYDGDGRRVKKAVGVTATVFVYNALGQLVAEYGSPTGSEGTSYVTQDNLGSTRLVTGADGQVKSRHDYLPFGEEILLSDVTNSGRTVAQHYNTGEVRQKFTKYERDNETGLDYAQARYYANVQGRFTSPDPLLTSGIISDPQSWNRYHYCLNNPFKYIDPSGLVWAYTVINNGKTRSYAWYDNPDDVPQGATVLTNPEDFYVEGEVNGKMVGIAFNPDGPYSSFKKALIASTAAKFYFYTDNFHVNGYEIGPTREQYHAYMQSGKVDMMDYSDAFELALMYPVGNFGSRAAFATKSGEAIFWTQGTKAAAKEAAIVEGGKTFEMTAGGRLLSSISNRLPDWASQPLIGWGSKKFAEGASGNVRFFYRSTPSFDSFFVNKELPALYRNPRVQAIGPRRVSNN